MLALRCSARPGFAKDYREVTFAWKPVEGTPFRVGVAFTTTELDAKHLASPPGTENCGFGCDIYHRINMEDAQCGATVTTKSGVEVRAL